MSKPGHQDEEDSNDCFYESLDRLLSSTTCSSSSSTSDNEEEEDDDDAIILGDPNCSDVHDYDALARSIPIPKFPLGIANNYEVWISRPSSVDERRMRLLRQMGLSRDSSLSRHKPSLSSSATAVVKFGKYGCGGDHLGHQAASSSSISSNLGIIRPNSADHEHRNSSSNLDSCREILSIHSFSSPVADTLPTAAVSNNVDKLVAVESRNRSGPAVSANAASPNKPPTGKLIRRGEEIIKCDNSTHLNLDVSNNEGEVAETGLDCNKVGDDAVCTIKNLDNGKEFVVDEVREDGMWGKLKEVGTGRHLTMEEFEICVGHSPIVQELMRRQNVEAGNKDSPDTNSGVNGSKLKQKGGWLKSIRNVASSVTGHKERRSSDERDTSSEKGGRRSSSATDDSQDVSFHGPERVRVRQYGKSCKDLTALYKSQEIQAHNGSIWTIKFSLDGKYLASAGEDCLIHVWQVVSSDRKGDLLFDKQEDGNLNVLLLSNGSPEAALASPNSQREKKRRGRLSISRKSTSLDHIVVPETMFALSEKPVCSFKGHLDDVLDLSWSKSQDLLSSSMDKTVRLWQLSSKSCLKIFSHNDYVTCIQFNPVDDRYFISGSLDAKVRIWSIPDRQVVDWNDMHEMVTAACYTPDGQFAPGTTSEVLITSADSRIRALLSDVYASIWIVTGFRSTNRQISASVTANGRYVVCASEDSQVYVWKHEGDSRPSRNKGVKVTQSYEHFHCQDVSVAIPWPGMTEDPFPEEPNRHSGDHLEVSAANHPPTPEEETNGSSFPLTTSNNNPFHGIISSASNGYFFDRFSATWPEEKLIPPTKNQSPHTSSDFMNGVGPIKSAWGMVIVTAGLHGEIRTFQNFGLPVRI
ncbi:G-protein beta WD-40 repeat-containing protein [Cynara cardunculus var. scolymus]|uniref:G-protein beta WD-40 repeat-containing protein n=1 Tax=Cynara cardunculus var. scolymus TaxID=59895 RepID=A0A124SE65_CYNCS|nr:G-protein beta WD-40 repeat-containing protein [Cynara cardunculus var. scolymus]